MLEKPVIRKAYSWCRALAFGSVVSLAMLALGGKPAAQESRIPYFRSGAVQFAILEPRMTLPSIVLFPLKGKAINLSSLRGQPILLNFWATWCAACRMEMPALDRLQAEYRRPGLQILAVSTEQTERAVVDRYVTQLRIQNLKIYLDPNGYVAFHGTDNIRNAPFALYGMPITYAIAASGWVVGYVLGAADWTSQDARELIEFLRRS